VGKPTIAGPERRYTGDHLFLRAERWGAPGIYCRNLWRWRATVSDFARLRLIWEPRLLSISRIMIGLLFMEHGTAKVLDFPHQETHKVFDLLTLNPGAQGSIELIGGFLFAV